MDLMRGATGVAAVAALGNFLQGWDSGAIAGALLYLKPEFHMEETPALEGLVVASTLLGAVASVVVAGPAADWLGRKVMLCVSGLLYSIAAMVMLWSPSVLILILSRATVGLAMGLACTIAPILISESAPAETRGQLATFPQLLGSLGLFLAYVMDFVLSLQASPNWRFMLGVLAAPSILYVFLCVLVLPESPRWLVSKGRMHDAKLVLQKLRGQVDVSAELALLVEGLNVVIESHLEEWLIKPADEDDYELLCTDDNQIKLFAPDESVSWVATPIVDDWGHSGALDVDWNHGSALPKVDPMVTLIGSFQTQSEPCFMNSGDAYDDDDKHDHWDEEAQGTPRFGAAGGYYSETDVGMVGDHEDELQHALLGHSNYGSPRYGSYFSPRGLRHNLGFFNSRSSRRSNDGGGAVPESLGSVGVGGGWQLAWQKDGEEGALKRVYLKSEGDDCSNATHNLSGFSDHASFPAAVLVTQTASSPELLKEHPVGPAMLNPAEIAKHGSVFSNLMKDGVRRALIVGVGIQILQQFSGINAVLYYTPQILMQSGAGELLASIGIDGESASILASGVTCLLMLPCIIMAMGLMDKSGRRQLLLATIPILVFSLVALVLSNVFLPTGLVSAAISFIFVTVFTCSFVTGFGPIPNILCSEIFPTSVRGLCIGICAASMMASNVVVTYSFPLITHHLGLQGVFALFATVCTIAWVFVFLKVPETKGLPLEIISDFFAVTPPKNKGELHH